MLSRMNFERMKKTGKKLFSFEDPYMEHRYREYFVRTTFDRARPVLDFWLPVRGIMRSIWLLYLIQLPKSRPSVELCLSFMHVMMFFVALVLFRTRWSDNAKARVGLVTLWLTRAAALVAGLQQISLQASHSDTQIMSALIGCLCLSGLALPSFAEYLIIALFIAFARPFLLYLFSGSNSDLALQSLFQHSLMFALGTSIMATVHFDCRRDWLRSSGLWPALPKVRKHRSGDPPVPAIAAAGRDEAEDDGFLTGGEQCLASQVRCLHGPYPTAAARNTEDLGASILKHIFLRFASFKPPRKFRRASCRWRPAA